MLSNPQNMKILITGATGFVGKTLAPYLYNNGVKDLCLLVRSVEKAKRLFGDIPITLISMADDSWMENVQDYNPDVTLHLATYFTNRRDNDSIVKLVDSNILFTTRLLEVLSHTYCRHFVNIGTFTEFINGGGEYTSANLYSATKTAVRPIIKYYQQQSEWNWINVVVYSPYGRKNESKKVIDYLLDAVDAEQPVAFSPGYQTLDFIHVDDMADFFLTLLDKLDDLQDEFYEFHLGTGEGHTVRDVAVALEKVSGKHVNADWGGRDYSPNDAMHAVAPVNKNITLLGWQPRISLEEGIRILWNDVNVNKSYQGGEGVRRSDECVVMSEELLCYSQKERRAA